MLSSSTMTAAAQVSLTCSLKPSKLPFLPNNSIFPKLNPTHLPFYINISHHTRHPTSPTSSTSVTATEDSSTTESEKLGVVVKLMEKPRIVLKFIWMDRNIGFALDQVIPGHGSIPLGPYYFWPRKDAWNELKSLLESKPWTSQKQAVQLLNQATDIINLWQQ